MTWAVWEVDDRRESVLAAIHRDGVQGDRVSLGEAMALGYVTLPDFPSTKAALTPAEALRSRTGPFNRGYLRGDGWLRQCPSCRRVPEFTRGRLYSLADAAEASGQRTIEI